MTTPQETLSSVVESTEPSIHVGVLAPILFTEQEVSFSTAVALAVRPAKMQRWAEATAGVLAALQRMVLTLTPEERASRRYYSNHYDFIEESCMAREMQRL